MHSNTIRKYVNFTPKNKIKNAKGNNSSYLGNSSRKDLEEMFPSIEIYVLLYIRYQKIFPFWIQHDLLYGVLTERGFSLYSVFVRLYILFHVLSSLKIYTCKMCVPDKDQDTVQNTDLSRALERTLIGTMTTAVILST